MAIRNDQERLKYTFHRARVVGRDSTMGGRVFLDDMELKGVKSIHLSKSMQGFGQTPWMLTLEIAVDLASADESEVPGDVY